MFTAALWQHPGGPDITETQVADLPWLACVIQITRANESTQGLSAKVLSCLWLSQHPDWFMSEANGHTEATESYRWGSFSVWWKVKGKLSVFKMYEVPIKMWSLSLWHALYVWSFTRPARGVWRVLTLFDSRESLIQNLQQVHFSGEKNNF